MDAYGLHHCVPGRSAVSLSALRNGPVIEVSWTPFGIKQEARPFSPNQSVVGTIVELDVVLVERAALTIPQAGIALSITGLVPHLAVTAEGVEP